MSRGPRLDEPGSYHHVMSRGTGGEAVFGHENDAFRFYLRLDDCMKKSGTGVLAWAIMPTHFHLLLRVGEIPLSKIMRSLLTGFCVEYNLAHERKGHVFMGRFQSILVQDDPYLTELIRYIHLNPVRKGITTPVKLGSHRWSGHREVIHPIGPEGLIDRSRLLELFGRSEDQALRSYRDFLADGTDQKWQREFEYGTFLVGKDGIQKTTGTPMDEWKYDFAGAVLGTRKFAEEVVDHLNGRLRTPRDRGEEHEAMIASAGDVAEAFSISLRLIRGASRRKDAIDARKVLCVLFSRAGISTADIGRFFRMTQQGAWLTLQRYEEQISERWGGLIEALLDQRFHGE